MVVSVKMRFIGLEEKIWVVEVDIINLWQDVRFRIVIDRGMDYYFGIKRKSF